VFTNDKVTRTKNLLCDYLSLLAIPSLTFTQNRDHKIKIEILAAARDACIHSPEIGMVERLMLHKRVASVIN
jgi:hypothetical protein